LTREKPFAFYARRLPSVNQLLEIFAKAKFHDERFRIPSKTASGYPASGQALYRTGTTSLQPFDLRRIESPFPSRNERLCARIFWIWLALRTALWSVVLFLVQPNPALDVVEMLTWGRHWQWGYHKHPPLPAWMAEAAYQLVGGSLFGVYLLTYLCVAVAIWAVWRLARTMLEPRLALLSALALDANIHYTWFSAEFNNNVALTTFWALTAAWGYFALRSGALNDWLLLGLFAGLGLLAKYSLVFLAAPMALYFVFEPSARKIWRTPGPYVALAVSALLFAPHCVWLARNDFPTLRWAKARSQPDVPRPRGIIEAVDAPELSAPLDPWGRIKYPVNFLVNQSFALLPLAAVAVFAFRGRRRLTDSADLAAHRYLLAVVLGPLALQLLMSVVTGGMLRSMWGMSLWPLFGLLLFHTWRLRPTPAAPRLVGGACVALGLCLFVLAIGQSTVYPRYAARSTRNDFPGRQLATEINNLWRQRFATPLPMVVGGFWYSGNVGLFAPDRPEVYASPWPEKPMPSSSASPWASDAAFLQNGGVIVWDVERYGDPLPAPLLARFPTIRQAPTLTFPSRSPRALPTRIGVALAPPLHTGVTQR